MRSQNPGNHPGYDQQADYGDPEQERAEQKNKNRNRHDGDRQSQQHDAEWSDLRDVNSLRETLVGKVMHVRPRQRRSRWNDFRLGARFVAQRV